MHTDERWIMKRFNHTNRKGAWIGIVDFFTGGTFLLFYMPLSGLQDEINDILDHETMPYWKAYLLGIPTLFIYTLIWFARIAEELKAKAIELGVEGPYTSFRHMFGWNLLWFLLAGPVIATRRFFDTLNKIEITLNNSSSIRKTI